MKRPARPDVVRPHPPKLSAIVIPTCDFRAHSLGSVARAKGAASESPEISVVCGVKKQNFGFGCGQFCDLDLGWRRDAVMIAPANVNVVCTARQLGEIVGVTYRRIQQLTREGVLKCVRNCRLDGGRRYHSASPAQLKVKQRATAAARSSSPPALPF